MAGKNGWVHVAECIYRRDKTYQVRLVDPHTGKKATFGPKQGVVDRKSAFKIRDEKRAEFHNGLRRGGGRVTIRQFFKDWPTNPKLAESTRRHYREQVEPFIDLDAHELDEAEFVEGTPVGDLQFGEFTRAMARRYVAKYGNRSRAVSVMFTDAAEDIDGLVNPFHKLGLGRGKGRKELVVVTREEVDLLAECARGEHGDYGEMFEAMVLTLAWTAVRPGELFVLRWQDVDWNENRIHVRRAYRSKTKEMVEYAKNKDQRKVVLPAPLRDPLRRLQASHDPSDRPAEGRDNLFATRQGSQFMLQSFQYYWQPVRAAFEARVRDRDQRRWRELFETADGKHRPMDPYELRHFCATYLLERGVPAHQVAVQLGHKDNGALVLDTYGHPSRDAALAAIDAAVGL